MNKFQLFACGQIFHSFPLISFSEILELCEDDKKRDAYNASLEDTDKEDEQLILSQRYEYEWWANISGLLEELVDGAEYHFS